MPHAAKRQVGVQRLSVAEAATIAAAERMFDFARGLWSSDTDFSVEEFTTQGVTAATGSFRVPLYPSEPCFRAADTLQFGNCVMVIRIPRRLSNPGGSFQVLVETREFSRPRVS
jgi:hypothetical protein